MPEIDVVIPVHNCAAYIKKTIDSVLAQELPCYWKINIIIVDDCSTDDGHKILEQYYKKIKICNLEENVGRASARNIGVASGKSEYLLFLDCDCQFENSKSLYKHINEVGKGYDACFGIVTSTGNKFWSKYQRSIVKNRMKLIEKIGMSALSSIVSLLIKREKFHKAGQFNETYTKYGFEDKDFILRLINTDAKVTLNRETVVHHNADIRLETVCRKMELTGRYSAPIFKRNYPQEYARMGYGKMDYKLHPVRLGILLIAVVYLKQIICIGELLLELKLVPFPMKCVIVKVLSGLSYLKGTRNA